MNNLSTNYNQVSPFIYHVFIEVSISLPKIPQSENALFLKINSAESIKETFKIYQALWTLDKYESIVSNFPKFNPFLIPEQKKGPFIINEKYISPYLKQKVNLYVEISRDNFGETSRQIFDYLFTIWKNIRANGGIIPLQLLTTSTLLFFLLWFLEGKGMNYNYEDFIKFILKEFKKMEETSKLLFKNVYIICRYYRMIFYRQILELLEKMKELSKRLYQLLKDFVERFGYLKISGVLSLLIFLAFFIKFLFKILGKLRLVVSSGSEFSFRSAKLFAMIKKILSISNLKIYLKYLLRILRKFRNQIDQIEEKKSRHYINLKNQLDILEQAIYELAEIIYKQENLEYVLIEPSDQNF